MLYMLCWLVKNGYDQYLEAANNAANYLMSSAATPYGVAYYFRDVPGKSKTNGLIGQAWVMESLIFSSKVLNRGELYLKAEELFKCHSFDLKNCAWHEVDLQGRDKGLGRTFNQQLWFAYVASQLKDTDGAEEKCKLFCMNVLPRTRFYRDGVIVHDSFFKKFNYSLKDVFEDACQAYVISKGWNKQRERSVGYQGFNMLPFAKLYHIHGLRKLVDRLVSSVRGESLLKEMEYNRYGLLYNPSGFEICEALLCLPEFDESTFERWLLLQLNSYDDGKLKRSPDIVLTRARLYELCRLYESYNDMRRK